jgi:N-acetylmuramoyl-L-alanine amidase
MWPSSFVIRYPLESSRLLRKNTSVLHLRNGSALLLSAASCLLAFLLAGCATDQSGERVPDWEAQATVTPPTPAPPPAPAPAPILPKPVPPAPLPAPTNEVAEAWVPLQQWCKSVGLNAPCQVAVAPSPAYALNTSNGVFVLRIGAQAAYWDGLEFQLGFAPQMVRGQPFVHSLDLKKTLEPLISGAVVSFPGTNRVIVLDPGHGGEDAGTKSVLGDRYEREYTLDWARRLAGLLATNGWQVLLTRTNDVHLSLSNRVAFAEEHKASLFVSLHFNSAGANTREAGLETYCVTPAGMFSSITRGYDDDPAMVFPNNAFDTENVQLAAWVHRALLHVNGRNDRGIRHARYLSVLRAQHRPAILVEGGYLSNPIEARRIADPAYRERMAEAVAKVLTQRCEAQTAKPVVRGQEPAAAGQQSQARSQRSESRDQRSEIRSQPPPEALSKVVLQP